MKTLSALAVIVFLSSTPRPASAQALAKATSIRCTFTLMVASNLREESPKAEVKPSTKVLQFDGINTDEGTAQLKSDYGPYDIVVRYAQGYLHFIQSFRDG